MPNKSFVFVTIIFISFLFFAIAYQSKASSIEVSTCEQSDIQQAIDSSSDGDIILIPAGNCSWTSTVTVPEEKGITIQGAGIDRTIIVDNISSGGSVLYFYTSNETSMPRVTGITFDGNMQKKSGTNSQIFITGNARQFRVDHCKVTNLNGRGIVAVGGGGDELYGVIDNCIIELGADGHAQGVAILGGGPGNDIPWERPLTLGTEKAVYIEDNTFNFVVPGDGALDAYYGARYVFRHNTVIGTHAGHHGCDSSCRGVHSFEYYENTFTKHPDYETGQRGLFFRGGTGVVFNNTWVSDGLSWQSYGPIEVSSYCSCEGTSCGIENMCTEYPCKDQIGRTTDMDGDGVQDLAPLYEWNNINNGKDQDIQLPGSACSLMQEHIQEGRDYFNDTEMPGYTSYTYPHPLRNEAQIEIRADVNQDGSTNASDALLTLRYSLAYSIVETDWSSSDTTGDVNCDSNVNAADALLILRYSLGLDMSSTLWCVE